VLPDGCMDVLFTTGRRGERASLSAIGTMTRFLDASEDGVVERIGVRFRAGAGARFLDVDASELTDKSVPLEALWGRDAASLLSVLERVPATEGRLAALERALTRRLPRLTGREARWMRAAERLAAGQGLVSPTELARELGLSERQLRRGFLEAVGVSPKRLGRIFRLQAVLSLAADKKRHWGTVAIDAGYYDQAHLISDFKSMTGTSPGRFFEEQVDA